MTNASATGGTTDGGLERLPPHLKQRIDILILELGINDAFRGVPIDQIQKNLQQIIDKVKTRNPNARVVIAGIQLPGFTADDYVSAFGQMFVDLAEKNRAALVPYLLEGVAGNPSLNLSDGIHPNAAGQKILAENVWRVLEPVAREVAGTTAPISVTPGFNPVLIITTVREPFQRLIRARAEAVETANPTVSRHLAEARC